MGKPGPETRLLNKMRKAGKAAYGSRLVQVKYHGDQYSEAGVSDLLCCLDGVFVAAEVKAPESYGGSVERALEEGPTLKQRAFLNRVQLAGGIAGVVATVEQYLSLLARVTEQDWGSRGLVCSCIYIGADLASTTGCPVHDVSGNRPL